MQAVLKGDKMDDVVRDATMMGVAAIEPIVTARTIARAAAGGKRPVGAGQPSRQPSSAAAPSSLRLRHRDRFDEWLGASAHGLRLMLVEPSAADVESGSVARAGEPCRPDRSP